MLTNVICKTVALTAQRNIYRRCLHCATFQNTHVVERYYPIKYPEDQPLATQDEINEYVWKQPLDEQAVYETKYEYKDEMTKLILVSNSDDFGSEGKLLNIKKMAECRKLVLSGVAVFANERNLKKYEKIVSHNKEPEETIDESDAYLKLFLLPRLRRTIVPITINAYNRWTIESWHILVGLRRLNLNVPLSEIELPSDVEGKISGPNQSLEGKAFIFYLTVDHKYRLTMRAVIHHKESAMYPKKIGWQHVIHEPVFESQRRVLNSLPRYDYGRKAASLIKNESDVKSYKEWRLNRARERSFATPDYSKAMN